jgi:MOSC domain-containing protein YiiM
MPDRSANPKAQLAIMNSRVVQLLAGERERWPLAGDQLYIDLDLSEDNLPPGTQLAIGEVVLEITDQPHTGCAKFTERYGPAAIRFVNSKAGRAARRRGVHARVVVPGIIRAGERVVKVAAE